MAKRIKAFVTAVLSCVLMLFCVSCGNADTKNPTPGGNTDVVTPDKPTGFIVKNGKITLDGKPFYGAGINYFSLLTGCFSHKWDISKEMHALEVLKEYDCKVIRFSTLPFYANQMGYYLETGDMYWNKLDQIVEKCEQLGMGLIPSLFWTQACFDYYHESYQEAFQDENSQGMKFIKDYTEKFVKRYAESPAIYGWEFSNEMILLCDLPDRKGEDRFYDLDALSSVYRYFAEIVAANDPYGRMISTGDTNPRMSQYHQWKSGTWEKDTFDQHREVIERANPGKIDAVSQHQYALNTTLTPGNKTTPLFEADTWEKFFRYLQDISSDIGKACYVGEAGYGCDKALGWQNVTVESLREVYKAIKDAAIDTQMQLVLFWNYDAYQTLPEGYVYGQGGGVEYSSNENLEWGKIMLSTMKSINARFAAEE